MARFFPKSRLNNPNLSPLGILGWLASKVLCGIPKMPVFKSKKILLPDVPPQTSSPNESLIIAGIGIFCATLVIGAVLFVFLGA
jgi:hypothetical protein